MSNWIIDYHHALMLRLVGVVVFLGVWMTLTLIGRWVWRAASSLMQRPPQGIPLWHHRP